MIYPKFLKKDDLIGITALSSGCKNCLDELEMSVNNLKKDYKVITTNDVYGDEVVSASTEIRIKELNELLEKDIQMLYIARGGNFLFDTIPYINYKLIKKKKIWVQGYSDPTSLLYILTTKYDLATIYGINGKGYDKFPKEKYQENNLEIIKGHLIEQRSFHDRNTVSLNGDFTTMGIMIGGCLECLKDVIGTKFDNTKRFIKKYHRKRIIWYFDIFGMSSIDVYLTLSQFKQAGWFKYSDTFLFGSVLYPNLINNLDYTDMIKKSLDNSNYNIVIDANIGHVKPNFTIINGCMGLVSYMKNELIVSEEIK